MPLLLPLLARHPHHLLLLFHLGTSCIRLLECLPLSILFPLAEHIQLLQRLLLDLLLGPPRLSEHLLQELGFVVVEGAVLVLQARGFLKGFLLCGLGGRQQADVYVSR